MFDFSHMSDEQVMQAELDLFHKQTDPGHEPVSQEEDQQYKQLMSEAVERGYLPMDGGWIKK